MKIAYILGSLNRGGTETLLLDTLKHAREKNIACIAVYRKKGTLEDEFINSGVPVFQEVKKSIFNIIPYLFSLRKLLKNNKVQIVHAQLPLDAFYAYLACWGTGIKIVLTFHGYDFDNNCLSSVIIRFIIKHTDANIYVSAHQKGYYVNRYKLRNLHRQYVVHNGISLDKLVNISGGTLKKELKISSASILLGSVGNFVAVRDQLTVCRFLALLHNQGVDFHFVFAGQKSDSTPALYDDCIKFCTENNLTNKVHFLGLRNDVPSILNQLDAFIYATNYDTFGIAVVEAMAVGIPVFANDQEVMREITENGRLGYLYKTGNVEDLLQKVITFLANKEEYSLKAKKNSIVIKKKYTILNYLGNLRIVYSKLLDSNE